MVNFIELCKTLLTEWELATEATTQGLAIIASQARKFKREYSNALATNSYDRQQQALNNLVKLQQQLRLEYGSSLSDEQLENVIKKSSFYLYSKGLNSPADDSGGLIFLSPTYIKKLDNTK